MSFGHRSSESGVVLINVLVILSIASIVVFLMLTSQETSLRRFQALAAGSAAEALVRGAESSAITALRRDMLEAPETDHYAEPWGQVAQQDVDLDTGFFSVGIRDAQAKFNLSRLRRQTRSDAEVLLRILSELEIPRSQGARIASEIAARPALSSLSDLTSITPATLGVITPYLDFLPNDATLNLNTADALLLHAVLNNRSAALRLERRRAGQGYLTADDFEAVGVVRPSATGLTSQTFDVDITAEVGGIATSLTSRIERRTSFEGRSVVVARRQYGVPLNTVPAFPQK